MSQTLFQRMMFGKEVVEYKYFNPAKAKIGNRITIDYINYRGNYYAVKEIVEYSRKNLKFCDYVLGSTNSLVESIIRLRFIPNDKSNNVLVLNKYDELQYSTDLDKAVRDVTGEFVITIDDVEERYFRPEVMGKRLSEPYAATIRTISDVNGDGEVEESEVFLTKIEYWDFARITNDEANQQYTQYLYVELNLKTTIQTIWRGEEIDPNNVNLL